jgi:hypothetical protein
MFIKPKTRNQIFGLSLTAVAVSTLAIYVLNSLGFCYERHNGLYCYQGTNLNLVGMALLFSSAAIFVHLVELKARSTIKVLRSSLSLAVFCFGIVIFGVAVFMAGPNA